MPESGEDIILVTGAGSGLGKGVAEGLARAGKQVVAGVRDGAALAAAGAPQGIEAGRLRYVTLDVTNADDIAAVRDLPITTLVNNAGVLHMGAAAEIPIELVRESLEVNLFGGLALAQAVLPGMIARGRGNIVWTSSIAGLVPVPWGSAYAASKHAVEGLAASMRAELAGTGVHVATINPGPFRTGFNDAGVAGMDRWRHGDRVLLQKPDLSSALASQFDPQDAIDAMVAIILDDTRAFRNLLPAALDARVKQVQSDAWTWHG